MTQVLICEGAKKGIVARLKTPQDITVLSIPGKNDVYSVAEAVKDCQKVWVTLDPDATEWAYKLASLIGKAARVVEVPTKLDDAFLFHGLLARQWEGILRQGVKVVI
jgi:hypothetical protein